MDFSLEWFNVNSGFVTFIAAMIALLVGIIAAGISIWNTLITQRGLRLQYQPELVVKSEAVKSDNRQVIRFILIENIGSGTAYQIKYNQEFVDFIRVWTDQKVEMTGHDLIDSLLLENLQRGECKKYSISSRPVYGNSEAFKLNINISYTDIFKKYKGKLDRTLFIA
ncbi:hypothetical protein F4X90_11165 [Candidatus Poribacteria bacterium]|nr:hypothetical protein [Candidatus Poribacteria bacterium]